MGKPKFNSCSDWDRIAMLYGRKGSEILRIEHLEYQSLQNKLKYSTFCVLISIRFISFYAFFWVIPRRLEFTCRRFGTLCQFHLHRQVDVPMKIEQTECSETSACKLQTPGNYSKESIQHTENGESLKSRIDLSRVALYTRVSCSSNELLLSQLLLLTN